MIDSKSSSEWHASVSGHNSILSISGNWTTKQSQDSPGDITHVLDDSAIQSVSFNCHDLGDWDSALLVFLSAIKRSAKRRGIRIDGIGLPVAAQRLLALIPDNESAPPKTQQHNNVVERVGDATLLLFAGIASITAFVGDVTLRSLAGIRGKARMRRVDAMRCIYDAGIAALPMVALVNILVGGILAFVGAVELRKFGADIYIANLVGAGMVREMAAIMTAIVMSGRTGGAYAAEIAAMQGSDELDALRVVGIPVLDYLILPRVLALTLTMPLLFLYASAFGILGGFAVAVVMLGLSPQSFISQTFAAVTISEVLFGLVKSVVFGSLIAIVGCRIGMRAGRSSSDVGHAATSAVVVGIVGIIVLDAGFAICANALGI